MKRSEINAAIKYVMEKMGERGFPFPSFAYYSKEDWNAIELAEYELIENMLGWDVTDFGSEKFPKIGLTIFTFRNGNFHNKIKYPKPYAEKLLYVLDGQILPFHYHWSKMEDIINRGGGDLKVTLYNAKKEDISNRQYYEDGHTGMFDDGPVEVILDGKKSFIPAGSSVICKPGSSITLMPGQYHSWQGVPGTGDVILFEVSMVNDDLIDNRFYEVVNRIPQVEEDAACEYLMFADYPQVDIH